MQHKRLANLMPFHRVQHLLIALALLVTQFAGLVHGIEHISHRSAEALVKAADSQLHDWHGNATSSDILHSCLLFDGIATAQVLPALLPLGLVKPRLSQLGIQKFIVSAHISTLFAQRVRVRDPPLFS